MKTSPLDVPGVTSRLRRGELVELLRAERERAGEAPLDAIADRATDENPDRKSEE